MWKDIPGYEGVYEINQSGQIRRIETGMEITHIPACCKGKRKSANGYRWKYKENGGFNYGTN